MSFQVELRSREQILGDLIRTILANTDINDVSAGSDIATLLEAIATVMYQISVGSLKILENTNLESLVGNALDKKAASLRLPNTIGGTGRIPANQSGGTVTIGSSFEKVATKFYAGKPAPFAGSKTLYLENGSGFKYRPDGSLVTNKKVYIGRGTADRYEGPISYTTIVDSGSFWIITLAAPLTKNHLYSDSIVLAQGGDRAVAAGTRVQTSASSDSPAVFYTTTSNVLLKDGESETDAPVVCSQFGEAGNALAGAIKESPSQIFAGSTVTNKSAFKNGRSTESDEALRQRIKNYPATLSRGTKAAIQAAIIGISDPLTGRAITSSVVVEPNEPGDYSKVYIDDGSGLEPTFDVQPYELLLKAASGQETAFQTAQYPITPVTAIGSESGPFVLESGEAITVIVDGVSETYQITASNYQNLNASSAYELVRDLNSQSNTVGFRTLDGGTRIAMIDLSGQAEKLTVQVGSLQKKLGFPTSVIRPIFVYQDSVIQSFKGSTATLITNPYASWTPDSISFANNLFVVDGVPQTVSVSDLDFADYDVDMASATISQWAEVLAKKIAGCKFSVAGNVLICTTRQENSVLGTLEVPEVKADGSPAGWVGDESMWKPVSNGGVLSAVGASKDYKLNRFTGELKFIAKPAAGTAIEIGTRKTRAAIQAISTPAGLYALSPLTGTIGNARFVVGFDGGFALRVAGISIGDKITPTQPDAINAPNIIRVTANSKYLFAKSQVGDYMYLIKNLAANPLWGSKVEGIYRIKAVGNSFSPVALSYVSLAANVTSGSDTVVVNMTNHGMQNGARITTVVSAGFGGISAIDLSVALAPITVINNNSFSYKALAASPSNFPGPEVTVAGVIDTLTYDPDCWIEFEISDSGLSSQMADWSPLFGFAQDIDTGSISVFKSDGAIPQIIDMGAVGTVTVDAAVDIINSQVSCGKAYKLNGSVLEISSNDWSENGTIAILAVISTASSMFAVGIDSALQSHTAYSTSGYANGGSPVSSVLNQTADMPTSASIQFDKDLVDILTTGDEPQIVASSLVTDYPDGFESLWMTGKQSGLTGRVYNNQVSVPFTGILRTSKSIKPLQTSDSKQSAGTDLDRYSNYSLRLNDLTISSEDKLVLEMDLNPINKTVSVPLYKRAQIMDMDVLTGSGKGQVVSFRLKDTEDLYAPDPLFPLVLDGRPFFHNESVYKPFDFRDFKMLTKSVGLYREVTTAALPAFGFLTAVHASAVDGVQDGDTFAISDGVTALTFEFDSNSSVTLGNIAVSFIQGLAAVGTIVAKPMLPSVSLDEGDTFTLSDGIIAITFEFDSDSIYNAGNTPVPYVHGGIATGSITAWSADIALGVKDGDTFTIGSATFEFDDNATVSVGNVPVTILASWPSSMVKSAMISAINSQTGLIGVIATSGIGDIITLTYNDYGTAGNLVVTDIPFPNAGVTLYPVSLAGGVNNATSTQVAVAIRAAINASALAITASGIGATTSLLNSFAGVQGNVLITQVVASGVPMTVTGMAGGTANASATAIQAAMVSAITGAAFNVIASEGSGNDILLSNTVSGVLGNQAITESILTGATLSPIGMYYGTDLIANTDRALVVRSTAFGSPARLRVAIRLPSLANQANIVVSHLNGFVNGAANCNIFATLPSGATVSGSILSSGTYSVTSIRSGNLDLITFANPTLNGSGQYQIGNVLSVGGNDVLAGGYLIVDAKAGSVSVLSPSNAGITALTLFNANKNPLSSYQLTPKTFQDVATEINKYLVANPIATGEAIGTTYGSYPIKLPTYVSHASSYYTGGNVLEGLVHHSFDCKYAGSAGIWQYDSSDDSINNIKATAQSVDALFPTSLDAAGTTYSPINESVVLIPTNAKTLQEWLNFNATSSLTILAEALQVGSGKGVQVASKADGSLGGVKVTGVTGNALQSFVISNATSDEFSSKVRVLSTDAKALVKGQLVQVENSLTGEFLRPYRVTPTGAEITAHNGVNINTYFRQNNSLKYVKLQLNSARIIAYRYGQGNGQVEPLGIGDQIVISLLPASIVEINLATAGELAARVGDMMYIRPTSVAQAFTSPFAVDAQCVGTTGITNGVLPEYIGYPVIKVIDSKTIQVIAPNITTSGTTTLTSPTDLVFLPAIYNEKNVQTNKKAGAHFLEILSSGDLSYFIKALGGNLVSLWVANTLNESTDTMLLSEMSVNTDDYIALGEGFDASNQGTFKIVGHNGRNHVILYNPNGGKDEIIDRTTLQFGGKGQRKWLSAPINKVSRPIRILDVESVKIEDRLRISTPAVETSPWFPAELYGSWRITGVGYIAFAQARGSLTPVAADPVTGIKHLDSFTIHDGNRPVKFEFTTTGTASDVSFTAVKIQAIMSALDVSTAMITAINGLGSTFTITAGYVGGLIELINRNVNTTMVGTMNTAITHSIVNAPANAAFVTVGMSGAKIDDGQLTPYVDIDFPNAIADVIDANTKLPLDKFQVGGNDSAIGFIESTPFSGFRVVGGHCVNKSNAEESDVFMVPRISTNKMSETFGTKITALFKIGFEQRTFQGIDGYKVYAGLVREAHRVIDGLVTNPILYPGTKAMGAQVEVNPPLVKNIQLSLQVRPKDGVTINSISEIIRSTVSGYVNGLGVGKPVVISEIIRIVQGLPGVYSVAITSTMPPVTDDRIIVSDIESVFIHNAETDVTVG